jgi:hypothetical protein
MFWLFLPTDLYNSIQEVILEVADTVLAYSYGGQKLIRYPPGQVFQLFLGQSKKLADSEVDPTKALNALSLSVTAFQDHAQSVCNGRQSNSKRSQVLLSKPFQISLLDDGRSLRDDFLCDNVGNARVLASLAPIRALSRGRYSRESRATFALYPRLPHSKTSSTITVSEEMSQR